MLILLLNLQFRKAIQERILLCFFKFDFFDYGLFPSTVEHIYAFLKHVNSQAVLETVARVGRVKFKKNETNEEKYVMLS